MLEELVAVLVALAAGVPPQASCAYPCWTEIGSSELVYESFGNAPVPLVKPPYVFSLPYPAQPRGAVSHDCVLEANSTVDIYGYDPGTRVWTGPVKGPIYRYPGYVERSSGFGGWKGLAVQVAFTGKATADDPSTVIQSVFFHDERCYLASFEFGFSRYVKGWAGEDRVSFYYESNANCQPPGKCRSRATGENLIERRVNLPLAIPSGHNSRGGVDWLYEAYLADGGAIWRVLVLDPYTREEKAGPFRVEVQGFLLETAREYFAHGGFGYVTATSSRIGPLAVPADPPSLDIVKIFAAK